MSFLMIMNLLKFMIMVVPVLLSVAYLTLIERKLMGYSQLSKGPNMIGIYGLLQPLSDGLKLFSKELMIPNHVDIISYIFSPILALFMSLGMWLMIPFNSYYNMFNFNLGILFILAFGSINMYSMLISGWSSNSKYSFLGSISACAQMISYEVCMGLILFMLMISCGSMDLMKFNLYQHNVIWLMIPYFISGLLFFVCCLAETNSAPFDLSEGESELVSGYNVEYSSMSFAYFFLGEYSHMMFMSFLYSILFLGGGNISLLIKALIMMSLFMFCSTSFPSFSYDQLMNLCWKSLLPISMSLILFMNFMLWSLKGLPI